MIVNPVKVIKSCILLLSALIFFFISQSSFAQTFNFVPKGDLPSEVPEFGKTSATFTITNNTGVGLDGNFIENLPAEVTQVTWDPNYCGATFNLGPSGSVNDNCTLKITIKAPVSVTLKVCAAGGANCDNSSQPLKITQGFPASFIGIGAGYYSNYSNGVFPLLAYSNDTGSTWTYPEYIFKNISTNIDRDATSGNFSGASCTGSVNKSVCVVAGIWCSGGFCDSVHPLIAVGTKNGSVWKYPKSVFQNLDTRIDPNIIGAELRAASCFGSGGSAVCMASGYYANTTQQTNPLISVSQDSGKNWTYPLSVFTDLHIAIDPSYNGGALFTQSCTTSTLRPVCIASGNFCNDANCNYQQPLLALSTDKGQTWVYPKEIFKDLTTKIDPNFSSGFFTGSSCTGSSSHSLCVAAGSFYNNTDTFPLLTLSRDDGQTWIYPPEIFNNLAARIGHNLIGGYFNAASCSGTSHNSVCIAAGAYYSSKHTFPFLALTRDGGITWTYPDFIYTKMRTVVDPDFRSGIFDGASCTGNGKQTICIAAGNYCTLTQCFPLLALSKDGGKSWSYPPSIYQNLTTTLDPKFVYGLLSEASCSGTSQHNFCTASGQYWDGTTTYPLVAVSTDSGATWTYPADIHQNLTTKIDPGFAIGSFSASATSGGQLKLIKKHSYGFANNLRNKIK